MKVKKGERFFADKPVTDGRLDREVDAVYQGSLDPDDPNTYVIMQVAGGEYIIPLTGSHATQLGERLIELAKTLPPGAPRCRDCGTWMTRKLPDGHECPYCFATMKVGKFRKGNFGKDLE